MRACACTRTRAGAAIFVQIGARKCSEMCVRLRAYISFKVWTCARTSAPQFLVKKFFWNISLFKCPFLVKKFFFEIFFCVKMCGCACGWKNWCAGACATHFQNLCDVRAGADENPRTLKVC